MQYATGEAVIESSLLVIGRSAIRLAVETRDQEPCLLLQKGEGGSVLRIHYRRIAALDVSYHILSIFIQVSFYAKNNTRIKITVQFSKKEGAPVAEALYRVFSSLYPHPSGFLRENKMETVTALKKQRAVNESRWRSIQETHSLHSSSFKQPPPTPLSSYLSKRPCLQPDPPLESTTMESESESSITILHNSCLIDRSFPTQKQAADFIDNYRNYDTDIKLFSYERITDKRRLFAALNETEFQWEYESQPHKSNPLQHAYEIIRENCPCKLYMDVEFEYRYNPGKNGNHLLHLLLRFISHSLFYAFGLRASPDDFSCIFSENRDKFSCHVVLNKQGVLFRNNIHLGRFMKWAVRSLECSPHCEFFPLFVNSADSPRFIADMAVYTKNRAMRLMKSSKFSIDNSKTPFNTAFSLQEWQLFLPYTLVTEFGFYKKPFRLLYRKEVQQESHAKQIVPHQRSAAARSDPFPFLSLVQHILSGWEFISHIKGGFLRNWTAWKAKSGDWKVRLDIGGNRWCMNKSRAHKSNHIYFLVDLHRCCFYQCCYDSDCRNYISPSFPVPSQEADLVSSFLEAEHCIECACL